jgi:peroxiredoxin
MHIRVACVVVLLISGLVSAAPAAAPKPTPAETQRAFLVGRQAPDLALKTLEGKTIKLSALKGQVVVLDFWATWCTHCVDMIPQLNAWHRSLKAKGLVVVGIAQDDEKDVREFDGPKMDYPTAVDTTQEALQKYAVQGLPMTTVIDKKGIVRFAEIGKIDHLEKEITALLK